jgi:exopolysaccharide production protein ExoZ
VTVPHTISTIPPSGGAYRSLDAWRGIAALWVVLFHSCLDVSSDQYRYFHTVPFYRFCLTGNLGVMLFFVVSGFCIAGATETALRKPNALQYFLFARMKRIYPPYFASSVLAIALGITMAFLGTHHLVPASNHSVNYFHQSPKYYGAALLLLQVPMHITPVVTVYWTLCYEVSFYAIVLLLAVGLGKLIGRSSHWLLSILTIATLIWLIVSPSTCPFPLSLWYQFGLGTLLYGVIARPKDIGTTACFIGAIALTVAYSLLRNHVEDGHPSTRVQAWFCIGVALVLLALHRYDASLMKNRIVQAAAWVGTFSYSLYLTHAFMIALPYGVGKKLHLTGHFFFITMIAQVLFAIAVAYGFHLAFEKPFLSKRAAIRELQVDEEINVDKPLGGVV